MQPWLNNWLMDLNSQDVLTSYLFSEKISSKSLIFLKKALKFTIGIYHPLHQPEMLTNIYFSIRIQTRQFLKLQNSVEKMLKNGEIIKLLFLNIVHSGTKILIRFLSITWNHLTLWIRSNSCKECMNLTWITLILENSLQVQLTSF